MPLVITCDVQSSLLSREGIFQGCSMEQFPVSTEGLSFPYTPTLRCYFIGSQWSSLRTREMYPEFLVWQPVEFLESKRGVPWTSCMAAGGVLWEQEGCALNFLYGSRWSSLRARGVCPELLVCVTSLALAATSCTNLWCQNITCVHNILTERPLVHIWRKERGRQPWSPSLMNGERCAQ